MTPRQRLGGSRLPVIAIPWPPRHGVSASRLVAAEPRLPPGAGATSSVNTAVGGDDHSRRGRYFVETRRNRLPDQPLVGSRPGVEFLQPCFTAPGARVQPLISRAVSRPPSVQVQDQQLVGEIRVPAGYPANHFFRLQRQPTRPSRSRAVSSSRWNVPAGSEQPVILLCSPGRGPLSSRAQPPARRWADHVGCVMASLLEEWG